MLADLVVDAECVLGEGPLWDDREHVLRWVDISAGRVHRLDLSGEHSTYAVQQPVSALALRDDGRIVLAMRDGFGLLDETTGCVSLLAAVERDDPTTRMNDGKCDSRGRFWAGTMALDFAAGRGTIYCLDTDASHTVHPALGGVTLSNGLAWSADDRILYFIDSATQRIDAIDFDLDSGRLGRRRPFISIDSALGMPDGMAMDSEGCFWVGLWGGSVVRRFRPDGVSDRVVRVPVSQVTSCAFGGSELDVLYITTAAEGLSPDVQVTEPHAGGVFAAAVGVSGMPSTRFGG